MRLEFGVQLVRSDMLPYGESEANVFEASFVASTRNMALLASTQSGKDLPKLVMLGIFCVLLVFSFHANAGDSPIGSIKTYRPDAIISRGGVDLPIEIGAKVYSGDTIITRSEGAVGITFLDGSVLSLGPKTEFIIENFIFEPDIANVSLLTRILRGTVSFISGAIGRISPQSVQFKTPTATLGLRGTKVLIKVD